MRTIAQDALSSVISDIQSASITQWLEPRLSYRGRGFEPWRGGNVLATLRSSYLLVINGYARHELQNRIK